MCVCVTRTNNFLNNASYIYIYIYEREREVEGTPDK